MKKILLGVFVVVLCSEGWAFRREDKVFSASGVTSSVCGGSTFTCASGETCVVHTGTVTGDGGASVCRQIIKAGSTYATGTVPSTFVPKGLGVDGGTGFLYVASNESTGTVDYIYKFNTRGAFTGTSYNNAAINGAPRGLTAGNNAGFVAVTEAGSGQVGIWQINPSNGNLTFDTAITLQNNAGFCGTTGNAQALTVTNSALYVLDTDGDVEVWNNGTWNYNTSFKAGCDSDGGGADSAATGPMSISENGDDVYVAFSDTGFNGIKRFSNSTYSWEKKHSGDDSDGGAGSAGLTLGFLSIYDGLVATRTSRTQLGTLGIDYLCDYSNIGDIAGSSSLTINSNIGAGHCTPTNPASAPLMSQINFMHQVRGDNDYTSILLSSFTGKQVEKGALLEWRTTVEKNNKGFNILRKDNEMDCYTQINQTLIPSVDNPTTDNYYFYYDNLYHSGQYNYLIEAIDQKDNPSYDGEVEVVVVQTRKGTKISAKTQWAIGSPRFNRCEAFNSMSIWRDVFKLPMKNGFKLASF